LFVRDLVVASEIGVHAHEKGRRQRVRINLDLDVEEGAGPREDRIAEVVDYEDIVVRLRKLVIADHVNLVETLAERIAQLCLTDRRVRRARVRVEKLDVFADLASVGVEIERQNSRI
jgi:dihydroneopterin aldolase